MTVNKFNLPDVGEGLTEAEIVSWNVKPGDTVAINDILCEIETAKSLVELPSPFAGTVTELLVPEGVTVDVGTPIISVSDAVSGDPTPADVPAPAVPAAPVADALPADAPMYGNLPEDDVEAPAAAGSAGRRPAGGLRSQGRRRQAPPAQGLAGRRRNTRASRSAVAGGRARPGGRTGRGPGHLDQRRCAVRPRCCGSHRRRRSAPDPRRHHQRPREPGPREASRAQNRPGPRASTWPTSSPPAHGARSPARTW